MTETPKQETVKTKVFNVEIYNTSGQNTSFKGISQKASEWLENCYENNQNIEFTISETKLKMRGPYSMFKVQPEFIELPPIAETIEN